MSVGVIIRCKVSCHSLPFDSVVTEFSLSLSMTVFLPYIIRCKWIKLNRRGHVWNLKQIRFRVSSKSSDGIDNKLKRKGDLVKLMVSDKEMADDTFVALSSEL